MFIKRNYERTVKDDWKLNVQPYISENEESLEIYDNETNSILVGWLIQDKFE